MKYQRKPEIVDAVQWFSGVPHPNVEQPSEYSLEHKEGLFYETDETDGLDCKRIRHGDYIVTYSDGRIELKTQEEMDKEWEKVDPDMCSVCEGHKGWILDPGRRTAICYACAGTGKVKGK